MKKRCIYYLTIFLLIILVSETAYSAYRESFPIRDHGTMYILDLDIVFENLNNYGVVAIYLASEGTYGFGFAFLKDPDENQTHLYALAGQQDQWFDLGYLMEKRFRARLVLDENLSSVFILIQNRSLTSYNVSYIPRIKELYISIFNITSRSADYPLIYVNQLSIYVSNNTFNELRENITNLDKQPPCLKTFSIVEKNIGQTPASSPASTPSPTQYQEPVVLKIEWLNILYIIITLVAVALIIIAIVIITQKQEKGSAGP